MYARKEEAIGHIKDSFSLSISDLMAGLMAIFILTICYFMANCQVKCNTVLKYTS